MFHILGFIFLFILVILIIGLGIIATIVRKLFKLGSKSPFQNAQEQANSQKSWQGMNKEDETEETQKSYHQRKKIFAEDDGEYVDFEEITPEK